MTVELENDSRIAVKNLRCALTDTMPVHDTPIGVVHPYWARKPMNILEVIIDHLTRPGDLVIDPFMGSGTTVFAALRKNRRVVGSDLSVLSQQLVSGLLDLIEHAEIVVPEIRRLLDKHAQITLPWFAFDDNSFVERVRFKVDGDYSHGDFQLTPTEVVTKRRLSPVSWGGRSSYTDNGSLSRLPEVDESWLHFATKPIDFTEIALHANSRIAIPRGATLAHYFTLENQASINVLLQLIKQSSLYPKHAAALKLVLSASLPMLRLSDKKASSQWPYWRPKTDLTSRNPVIVFGNRYKQITQLVDWSKDVFDVDDLDGKHQALAFAAQELTTQAIGGSARLVLTDPPYGEQVPYLEYSAMWNSVLGHDIGPSIANQELVRSDASHRRSDSSEYLERLKESFSANAKLLAPGGLLAWFYQDQDLRCWEAIYNASLEAELQLLDVIPLPKQRRSLKTVTSPNTTLDGDLLCVFTKARHPVLDSEDSDNSPLSGSDTSEKSYFDRYALLVSSALKSGNISELAKRYGTVKRALAATKE